MEALLKILNKTIPFPYFEQRGKYLNGRLKNIPAVCHTCNQHCYDNVSLDNRIHTCRKGFNAYLLQIDEFQVIVFGILIAGYTPKKPRKEKKSVTECIVELEELQRIEATTNELLENIKKYRDRKIKDNFALYHDIIPTISMIFRIIESMVYEVKGESFEEKVENADKNLRNLYHAMDMMDNRLKMMPLISNPDAAKYGQVTSCSPYKIFDKVKRLFLDTAQNKNVRINLNSNGYITSEPKVFDSFITLPFLLVENAIKYSVRYGTVDIYLRQSNGSVEIDVKSKGPVVSIENVERIFEKGFKDPNAQRFSSKGSGIGLYLVELVARAHNIEVQYTKSKHTEIVEGIEIGNNTFSFVLRD